jgi:hypothetical protein
MERWLRRYGRRGEDVAVILYILGGNDMLRPPGSELLVRES